MFTFSRRDTGLFIAAVTVAATVACGGSVNPTAPTFVTQGSGSSFLSGQSFSVVDGTLLQGGQLSSEAAGGSTVSAAVASGVTVTVVGTNITVITDGSGKFHLKNVPSGDVQLLFQGSGISATITLKSVGSSQHVKIKVVVQSTTAQVVEDERDEFDEAEGIVDAVDSLGSTFTLVGGPTIGVDNSTWWDTGGDLKSFDDLVSAHERGQRIEVEARVMTTEAGTLLAIVLKAETEEEENEIEVEGFVRSVDRVGRSLTLVDGTIVRVDDETRFDDDGLSDLIAIADAVDGGAMVKVEVEGSLQDDLSILASKIKAEVDDLELEIKPDEWRVDWATGSSSGSGDDTVEARIEGGRFAEIDPNSITMEGPDGVIRPVATDPEDKRFEAEFLKSDAIGIVASLPVGTKVTITVRGTFITDGTLWELTDEIEIEEPDDDDALEVDIANAIDGVRDLIEEIDELEEDGVLGAGNANALRSKLENVIKSLEKGNVTPAINQLGAFINQVESFVKTGKLPEEKGNKLIEKAEKIIKELQGND